MLRLNIPLSCQQPSLPTSGSWSLWPLVGRIYPRCMVDFSEAALLRFCICNAQVYPRHCPAPSVWDPAGLICSTNIYPSLGWIVPIVIIIAPRHTIIVLSLYMSNHQSMYLDHKVSPDRAFLLTNYLFKSVSPSWDPNCMSWVYPALFCHFVV